MRESVHVCVSNIQILDLSPSVVFSEYDCIFHTFQSVYQLPVSTHYHLYASPVGCSDECMTCNL